MTSIRSPANISPLDLPELRALVAQYLSKQECLQCILVNKEWHISFLCPIWRELDFSDTCRKQGRVPAPTSVRQHGHLIQTLGFPQGVDPNYSAIDFPYLQNLRISAVVREQDSTEADKGIGDKETEAVVLSLINSSPSLMYLKYSSGSCDHIPFDSIFKLRNLTELKLSNCYGSIDSTSALWNICAKLEILVLDKVQLTGLHQLDSTIVFPKIKILDLNRMHRTSDIDMLTIARRCINLQKLLMYFRHSTYGVVYQAVVEATWPKLRTIVLEDHFATSEADIARLLKAVGHPCVRWATRNARFGENAFRIMVERFSILESVELTGCRGMTSAMIQEILCSCSRLDRYRGGRINMSDIADGLPWACKSIRNLNVFIVRPTTEATVMEVEEETEDHGTASTGSEKDEEEEERVQRRVFEQIAQLSCLEKLIVGYNSLRYRGPVQPGELHSGLELKVSKGLDLLGGLKNLQTFRFRGIAQIMEAEDVVWMRDHWKQLEEVTGVFHYKDSEDHERLANILRECHITILT